MIEPDVHADVPVALVGDAYGVVDRPAHIDRARPFGGDVPGRDLRPLAANSDVAAASGDARRRKGQVVQ